MGENYAYMDADEVMELQDIKLRKGERIWTEVLIM